MRQPDDLADLAALSARIGADPLLVQAAGGNTSVKADGVLWIKASGVLLADALARDVFVPCDLGAMREAVAAGEERADQPAEFSLLQGGLRPSIETSLHAVFPQRVVVHVHCVNTIAVAIREDAGEALAARLGDFDWAAVSYAKPGARLAAAVAAARGPGTDVVVLGNHGLIVAAESVAGAEALLGRVVAALAVEPGPAPEPDMAALGARADGAFGPLPPDHPLHRAALLPHLLNAATGGSLYPDHVIFCGIGAEALGTGETPSQAVARRRTLGLTDPLFLLVPGTGALVRQDAGPSARALIRGLGDVLARLPEGARVRHLSRAEEAELLDWDAEKYRQSLNAR